MGGEFKWRHFAGEVILLCVRWYCRYGISYRDLEEMMGERGVGVDHTTLYRWTQRYAPELEKRSAWYRSRLSFSCRSVLWSTGGDIVQRRPIRSPDALKSIASGEGPSGQGLAKCLT